MVEEYNKAGYRLYCIHYVYHLKSNKNSFLGLFFSSMGMMLASNIALYTIAVNHMAAIKDVYMPPPKKPPDLYSDPVAVASNMTGYIACSSTLNDVMADRDFVSESFDTEEQVIVGLDTLAS